VNEKKTLGDAVDRDEQRRSVSGADPVLAADVELPVFSLRQRAVGLWIRLREEVVRLKARNWRLRLERGPRYSEWWHLSVGLRRSWWYWYEGPEGWHREFRLMVAGFYVHFRQHQPVLVYEQVLATARDISATAQCDNGAEIPLSELMRALYARRVLPTAREVQILVQGEEFANGAHVPAALARKFPELHKLLDKYMT